MRVGRGKPPCRRRRRSLDPTGTRCTLLFVSVHRLTKAQARRIAIRAQLLDARRPTDLLELVSHLTFLQLDPTAAIAPSADLVAWTRLGGAYRPAHLTQALEQDRSLYEVRAYLRPMADLGLHLCGISPNASTRPWPRSSRWPRPTGSLRCAACARWASLGPRWSAPAGSATWKRSRESRPRSRAPRAAGSSTRPRSARTSRVARRCCRRSTGWSMTASARRSCSTSSTTVHAIHEDVRFTRAMAKAVHAELEDLASWLGLGTVKLQSA